MQGMGMGMRPSFLRFRLTLAPVGTGSLRVSWARMERLAPEVSWMGKGSTEMVSIVPGWAAPSVWNKCFLVMLQKKSSFYSPQKSYSI